MEDVVIETGLFFSVSLPAASSPPSSIAACTTTCKANPRRAARDCNEDVETHGFEYTRVRAYFRRGAFRSSAVGVPKLLSILHPNARG